ncbi:hypothetical protein A5N82_13445 [Christensenella minuta]|uniref:Phage portal protein, SPP1 Gp6 n=1 Tax=Christensenella minuta TaxID=626937 RepID=A0A136Q8G4_9FIRM|nr:phage portal protein [Christensenella minuta]AYH40721.1 phage portal protein [Christensenella minuta]KXK66952.1 hypothetical protein HMPREF3293_00182 [Christensenella minuta]OAQ38699.1 hypothetical protein A5N82_13445 [Christensenella minuta]
MLTNLDWIGTGKPFPPECEKKRLERYEANEKLFEGKHKDVFGADFQKLADYLKKRNVDVNTVINYPQLLTKKTADFVCGEMPTITVGKKKSDELNDVLDNMGFANTLYEAIMDVSRFGNSPVKVLGDRISIVPPENWYPVVDAYDTKHVTQHVIAFYANGGIYAEIHDIGKYEIRRYEAQKGAGDKVPMKFGKLLSSEMKTTGADDYAVKVFSNVGQSKSIYGIDDYGVIADILRQLMWRLYCMDLILDKHSVPTVIGPRTALREDPITGEQIFVPGNYFPRDRETDAKPEYMTWEGNLQATQWEIDWLTNQLYTLSEMGAAFLEGAGKGEANSGTALRLRMTSPLIKARRVAGINTQTLKRVVRLVAMANNMKIDTKDIAAAWKDGLPDDRRENAEILAMATGNKPFMSQTTAVKEWGDLDDEAAQEEIDRIETEEAAQNPTVYRPMEITDGQSEGINTAVQTGPG